MGDDGVNRGKQAEVINVRARWNGSSGIYAQQGSTVSSNTVQANEGYGLDLGPQVGYAGNVISGNAGGTVFGPGVAIGTNLCKARPPARSSIGIPGPSPHCS